MTRTTFLGLLIAPFLIGRKKLFTFEGLKQKRFAHVATLSCRPTPQEIETCKQIMAGTRRFILIDKEDVQAFEGINGVITHVKVNEADYFN